MSPVCLKPKSCSARGAFPFLPSIRLYGSTRSQFRCSIFNVFGRQRPHASDIDDGARSRHRSPDLRSSESSYRRLLLIASLSISFSRLLLVMPKKAARRSGRRIATNNVFTEIAQRIHQQQLWRATFLEMTKPPAVQDQHAAPLQWAAPTVAVVASPSANPFNESLGEQRDCARARTK